MFFVASRLVIPLLLSSYLTLASPSVEEGQNTVCVLIGASISSSSKVYYPGTHPFPNPMRHAITPIIILIGDPLYAKGVNHWTSSSSQPAKCVVEPATAADVGTIVRNSFLSDHPNRRLTPPKLGIVGKTRTPFAVSRLALRPMCTWYLKCK